MLKPVGNNFVKSYRISYNLEALERVREKIGLKAYLRLRNLLEYRLRGGDFDRSPLNVKVAVAFSGGSDSSATVNILKWVGFQVVPVTVKLPQMDEDVLQKAVDLGAVLVDIPEYMDVMMTQMKKGSPICGRCHLMVMEAVEKKTRELGIGILATGDLLSSGLVSIYEKKNLVILNLPAFLALDKGEIIDIIGGSYDLSFGCPLLWELFRKAPSTKRFSIQRVLREVRAKALTPEIAEKLIMDILSR